MYLIYPHNVDNGYMSIKRPVHGRPVKDLGPIEPWVQKSPVRVLWAVEDP